MDPITIVIVLVYLFSVIGLGFFFSNKKPSSEDYLFGGRNISFIPMSMSYLMSVLSTVSLVAVPGEAYNHGLLLSLRQLLMPIALVVTFYLFIRFYFEVKTFTPFSYIQNRFNKSLRGFCAFLFASARFFYISLVLYSSSKVFEGVAGWPPEITMTIVGAVGIIYVLLGGMKAVVWTDVLQMGVLVGSIACVFYVAFSHMGITVGEAYQQLAENDKLFAGAKEAEFWSLNPYVRATFWMLIYTCVMEAMFYNSSDQISIQRLLSTKSYRDAEKTLWLSIVIKLPLVVMLWGLGLIVFLFYQNTPGGDPNMAGDIALFQFIGDYFNPVLTGLFIAAMLAAIMSTLDSGLHSLATVFLKDFYAEFKKETLTDDDSVRACRYFIVLAGVIAIAVSVLISRISGTLAESVIEAGTIWMAFQSVLAPIFLIGILSRKAQARHIYLAIACSWVVTAVMVGYYFTEGANGNGMSFMYVTFPGIVVMLLVGFLSPILQERIPQEIAKRYTIWKR